MFDAIRDCLLHFVTAAALGKSYQSSAHDGGLSPPHKSKHKSKHRTNTKTNIASVLEIKVFIGPESDHWQCLSVTHSLTH